MKNETLKKIITQLRKYDLEEYFENEEDFKKWILNLNQIQINNFISLDISKEEMDFPKRMLID